MARNITMFELHFDGPLFGENNREARIPDTHEREVTNGESEDDHGRWVGLVLLMVVTSMVVSFLAWMIARRLGVDG
jgi:hypothetical protein